jgi:hypothetical protein
MGGGMYYFDGTEGKIHIKIRKLTVSILLHGLYSQSFKSVTYFLYFI